MRALLLLTLGLAVAGCGHRGTGTATITMQPAPAPPAPAPPLAIVPPGPNDGLSSAATLWHLRAGLNVATLACRGAGDDVIAARYNGLLQRQKATLKTAQAAAAAEFAGEDGQARYDRAMTRLYNYFAEPRVHDAFCQVATDLLAEAAALPDDGLAGFAPAALARLDRPFRSLRAVGMTLAAVSPVRPAETDAPRLAIDPAIFRLP